jgi:hypothetical protein
MAARNDDAGDAQHVRVLAQEHQGADGIGALPLERRAALHGERFGKHEESVQRVCHAETRRDPEGQPRVDAAGEAAQRRSHHEAEPEGSADEAEARRAALRRRHVADVGARRRIAGSADAGEGSAHEEPAHRRRQRHGARAGWRASAMVPDVQLAARSTLIPPLLGCCGGQGRFHGAAAVRKLEHSWRRGQGATLQPRRDRGE